MYSGESGPALFRAKAPQGRFAEESKQVKISQRLQQLEPSATLAMAAKAKELKAAGEHVVDFSVGEPDFDTPRHICQAAARAMQEGHTHYTVASGIPELKAAIARQYHQRHGLEYQPSQVVVSNGAKHALHNVFTALLDPGQEVVIPAPYWVSYAELVKLASGVPRIVPTEESQGFKLTAEQLRASIGPQTRVLLLCSPSNPTGAMYTAEELAALADVVLEHDLVVVADEIYERLVYPGHRFASFPTVRPGLMERTVVVNGVSKAYAMTGWRIGWTLSPPELAKAMAALQSQETSNPCSISQYAALAALEGPQKCVEEMLQQFARRRQYVQQRVAQWPGVSCPEMAGAFYAFLNISSCLGRNYRGTPVENSQQWCMALLEQEKVATVMGSAFGAEGYVRLSYAAGMEELEEGLNRIERFLQSAS